MTQKEKILNHLNRYGKITSWEAIQRYRITRLSEYIRELRVEGHTIESQWIKGKGNPFVKYLYQQKSPSN